MRLTLLILLLLPAFAHAQRNAIVPDPDPEIERKSFIVDPRFEVNLYAADPLLAKPIHMNFDAAGRLWIASSEVYPQIKPGQKANDKIIVLEDTKGTGVADKTTVFADGLLIPTGLLPGDGGVYVANSTELIHLSDTKGTGKADKRRVVLSGFGTEDTHHMLHTLRWGPDGRMYMMQSIYIHSHIETPHGPRRLNAGGIWRFKPETMELDVFARGWVNPWGLAFDRYGQAFVTDGAGGEGINYVIPGGYYVTAADAKRVFPGLNPGSPKFCGLEIVSGRHLPDDWQGNLITNDFRGHRVCRFIVKDDGAGFASTEQPELIKSTHPAFRPIDVKMGPDGAIYIADWYNPIIQHGEVDFRDPRRDVTHGRIWRVTAKGKPLVKKPKIEGATTAELLETLKQPEQWTRDMARQELIKKGRREFLDVVKKNYYQLIKAINEQVKSTPSQQSDMELIESLIVNLWTYYRPELTESERTEFEQNVSIGSSTGPPFDPLHNTHQWFVPRSEFNRVAAIIRAQTTNRYRQYDFNQRRETRVRIPPDEVLLKKYAQFDSPRVRIEFVRLCGTQNDPLALSLALQVLNKPMDRFLDYALWLTVRELEPQWVPAFREGKLKFDDPKHLLFAVQASGSPELVEPLLKYLQQNDLKGETADALWNQVAQLGGPKELQILWEQCLDTKLSDDQRLKRLQALDVAARERKVRPSVETDSLGQLAQSNQQSLAIAAIRLIGAWNREKHRDVVNQLILDSEIPMEIRVAALETLATLVSPDSVARLHKLSDTLRKRTQDDKVPASEKEQLDRRIKFLNEQGGELEENRKVLRNLAKDKKSPLRLAALRSLSQIDLVDAAKEAALFMQNANEGELSQVLPSLLQPKNGPAELASAVREVTLSADVAKTAIRIARSTGQVHQPLIDALAKAGKLNTAKWEATPVVMKDLLEGIAKEGNAARGELVYRRKELNCLKCHGIGGSGGQIGPDMTSIGASAQPDYLIESLLLPSKAIKENFNTTVVSTVDGKVLTGIKQRENKDELILRDAEGNDVKISIKDIEGRADGKSLMPEGLVDGLTRGELVDLVRFLTELGKVGPYSVGTARVARTWEVLIPNAAANEAIMRNRLSGAVMMPKGLLWSSEYTTVAGVLPLEALPDVYVKKKGEWSGIDTQIGFARTRMEVGTAGEVELVIGDAKGVQLWLDQTAVELSPTMKLKLTAGSHVLTLAVNKKERSEGVRLEMKDVAGSTAQARWLLGR